MPKPLDCLIPCLWCKRGPKSEGSCSAGLKARTLKRACFNGVLLPEKAWQHKAYVRRLKRLSLPHDAPLTQPQLDLIRRLLDELEWSRNDIASQVGAELCDYEKLDSRKASELISALLEEKRIQRGEV